MSWLRNSINQRFFRLAAEIPLQQVDPAQLEEFIAANLDLSGLGTQYIISQGRGRPLTGPAARNLLAQALVSVAQSEPQVMQMLARDAAQAREPFIEIGFDQARGIITATYNGTPVESFGPAVMRLGLTATAPIRPQQVQPATSGATATVQLVMETSPGSISVRIEPSLGQTAIQLPKVGTGTRTTDPAEIDRRAFALLKHAIVNSIQRPALNRNLSQQFDDFLRNNIVSDLSRLEIKLPRSLSFAVGTRTIPISDDMHDAILNALQNSVVRELQGYVANSVKVSGLQFEVVEKAPEVPAEVEQNQAEENSENSEYSSHDIQFEYVKGQFDPDYQIRVNLNREFTFQNFGPDFAWWRDKFRKVAVSAVFHVVGQRPKPVLPAAQAEQLIAWFKHSQTEPVDTVENREETPVAPQALQPSAAPEFPQWINPRRFTSRTINARKEKIAALRSDEHYYDEPSGYLYLRGNWNAYVRLVTSLNNRFNNTTLRSCIVKLTEAEEQEAGRTGGVRSGMICVNSLLDNFTHDNFRRDEFFRKVYYVHCRKCQTNSPGTLATVNSCPNCGADRSQLYGQASRNHGNIPVSAETALPANDMDRFMYEIKDYRITRMENGQKKEYFPKRGHKETIAKLYSSQRLILGDETGTGKTSELVIAADMRTKEENAANIARTFGSCSGRVLIITLASVVDQFSRNVQEIIPNAEVSNSAVDGKKWTVMSYGAFNRKPTDPKSIRVIKEIVAQNFDVLILDECHQIKNPKSNTAQNIEKICEFIPYIWMASATISANRPVDIYNCLAMLRHPLGTMSRKDFMEQYTELSPSDPHDMNASRYVDPNKAQNEKAAQEGYDIANVPQFLREMVFDDPRYAGLPLQDKIAFAQRLAGQALRPVVNNQVKRAMDLAAMLILTDVYSRQTKEELWRQDAQERSPGASIEELEESLPKNIEQELPVDPRAFGMDALRAVRQQATDPHALVNDQKHVIADEKAPFTANYVAKLWQQHLAAGKPPTAIPKVLVFTHFHSSADKLLELISSQLQTIAPELKCLRAMGDTRNRPEIIEAFKTDPAVKCLILGIESGGTGLDLPNVTDDCFFNDFPWTPRAITQAKARIFRLNTKNDVHTNYVTVDGTPDKLYLAALKKKQSMADMVQSIDKEYAAKVKRHENTAAEVAKAQEVYWDLLLNQIKDAVIVHEYMKTGVYQEPEASPRSAFRYRGWLKKASA